MVPFKKISLIRLGRVLLTMILRPLFGTCFHIQNSLEFNKKKKRNASHLVGNLNLIPADLTIYIRLWISMHFLANSKMENFIEKHIYKNYERRLQLKV